MKVIKYQSKDDKQIQDGATQYIFFFAFYVDHFLFLDSGVILKIKNLLQTRNREYTSDGRSDPLKNDKEIRKIKM
jgi:hypothetical protein